MVRFLAALAMVATIAACSTGGGGSVADDDAADDDDDGPPRFQADIVPIFESSCGTGDNACHSRVAYGANPSTVGGACRGWLALENTALGSVFYSGPNQGDATGCDDFALYDRLLMNSWECGPSVFDPSNPDPNVPYVAPGDPDGSYLMRKIDGGPYCGNPSDPMPIASSLSEETIALIRDWIEAGAPE